jgi:cytochrome c553
MGCRSIRLVQLFIGWFILATGRPGWASTDRGQALFPLCAACHGNHGEGRLELGAPAIAGLPEWYVAAQLQKFRHDVRDSHPQDTAGLRMRPMARSLPTEGVVAIGPVLYGLVYF